MILVDTSVWIDHLRSPNRALADALEREVIGIHPFVIGELACGNLRNRRELLALWANLPSSPRATEIEALSFIEHHRLMGIGLGFIDVHLLASAALGSSTRLWTRDRQLDAVARKLGLAHNASAP
jgi:predicted nucleic acid-binding protein